MENKAKQSEFVEAILQIQSRLDILYNVCGTIEERLEPVCREEPGKESGQIQEIPGTSPLGRELFHISYRIQDLISNLQRLNSSLEL